MFADDEKSDEWIESYDSYSAEDEFEDEVLGDNVYEAKTNDREKSSSDNDDNSSDNEDNDEGDVLSVQNKLKSNPGWADAMAKILRTKKPTNRKAIVLSKAKKIKDVKPKKVELDFEIVGAENEENVKPNADELDDKAKIFSKKSTVSEITSKNYLKRESCGCVFFLSISLSLCCRNSKYFVSKQFNILLRIHYLWTFNDCLAIVSRFCYIFHISSI